MSAKKFDAMVDKAVKVAPWPLWGYTQAVGNLLKMLYSELMSIQKPLVKKPFHSRIRKKKRICGAIY